MKETGEMVDHIAMKEYRAFIAFHSHDEYLEAMVEDLSDWLNFCYNLKEDNKLTSKNFFKRLKDGVILCKHAHLVQSLAEQYLESNNIKGRNLPMKIGNQILKVPLEAPRFTILDFSKKIYHFQQLDNVSQFITWCRNFNIPPSLTFETEDLVTLKNPRNFVVALLELSKIGKLFGMEVPDIIQMDQEIEDEIIRGQPINTDSNNNNSDYIDSEIDLINNNGYHTESQNVIFDRSDNEIITNTCMDDTSVADFDRSSVKPLNFGYQYRRSSVNIIHPKFHLNNQPPQKMNNETNPLSHNESLHNEDSLANNIFFKAIRKSQSVFLNGDLTSDVIKIDNSDTESNFSQSSHSSFAIPKFTTPRPKGRVKIYDYFDKSNYVREKKKREEVDLRSLDERVRDILSQCKCDELFPMKRISEGRYQWGDNKSMIFVRILRTHVMVRVGGGWNTLGDFLKRQDPCRKGKTENYKFCLPAHSKKPLSTPTESDLVLQTNINCPGNNYPFQQGMVVVDRTPRIEISACNDDKTNLLSKEDEKQELESNVNKENVSEVSEESQIEPLMTFNTKDGSVERKERTDEFLPSDKQTITAKNVVVKLRIRPVTEYTKRRSSFSLIPNLKPLQDDVVGEEREMKHSKTHNSLSTKIPVLKSASKIPKFQVHNKK